MEKSLWLEVSTASQKIETFGVLEQLESQGDWNKALDA